MSGFQIVLLHTVTNIIIYNLIHTSIKYKTYTCSLGYLCYDYIVRSD